MQSDYQQRPWHAIDPAEVMSRMEVHPDAGLTHDEVNSRRALFGSNRIDTGHRVRWYLVLARQFANVLIVILALAALIAVAIGEPMDAIAIAAIIILNGLLGFAQEWKAERALAALDSMLSPQCTVRRDGKIQTLATSDLVPGDVVELSAGDRVPADTRLIEAVRLKIDESALTGESVPVRKSRDAVPMKTALAARSSMGWMGTAITDGRALGIVVATGLKTEFGEIARMTSAVVDDATPLQRKLGKLARQLGAAAVVIACVVGVAGWIVGRPAADMFMTAVSLAVAIVPEGLPAVVTITLGLGVRAMVSQRALLRRLQAAETLGAATVICTDKTGTLTRGEMMVSRVLLADGIVDVTGSGYQPEGKFSVADRPLDVRLRPSLIAALETAVLCNDASIDRDNDTVSVRGEPTEAALLVAAEKAAVSPALPARVAEFPFDPTRKRMSVVVRERDIDTVHLKGAPESVLPLCRSIYRDNGIEPVDSNALAEIEKSWQQMAGSGLRTLALASRVMPAKASLDQQGVEQDLTLLGIVGIFDPPRPEVPQAVRVARDAGIRIVIVTGDAAPTTLAVARQLGMDASQAISGEQIESWDDATLQRQLATATVFARTTPAHKLRIVNALRDQGQIVAMTGDGVNDAPALRRADIGVAMGIRGTDVARGASDMVLLDDNFASIIGAIREGRRQFDNIRKFVAYLLSSNLGEVTAIFLNVLLGGPLILLPVQILWINLVTDGVTAVALGMEPPGHGLMRRPPRDPDEPIVSRSILLGVVCVGLYIGLATLWLFHTLIGSGSQAEIAVAGTCAFTGLIVMEKINVFNFRSFDAPLRIVGLFTNRWVVAAWASMIGLQVCAVYAPFLQTFLHTSAIGPREWLLIVVLALPVLLVGELVKEIRWRANAQHSVQAIAGSDQP